MRKSCGCSGKQIWLSAIDDPSFNSTNSKFYEVVFHRSNFLHLTGVIINKETTASSINFYEKCIDGRLSEDDL